MSFQVKKRDGSFQDLNTQNIMKRVKNIAKRFNINVSLTDCCMKVVDQLYDKINTSEIDELLAEQLTSMSSLHYDYGNLAAYIVMSNLHKETSDSFFKVMEEFNKNDMISDDLWNMTKTYNKEIKVAIQYKNDFLLDYFGIKTLQKAYLWRIKDKIMERPQHMMMRVALSIHHNNIDKALETYKDLSNLSFTHATPTLFNAGSKRQQLSSCYLVAMHDDSIDGIYRTLSNCAAISKWSGGIGMHCSNIRSKNTIIKGTNGKSNGIVPMLKVFNETARYVDQGGGKRNGCIAAYFECWHDDIFDFLDLKKNHGDENSRARDLFYALWVDDEFMRRVKEDDDWYLCCPAQCPGLSDAYGDKFVELYNTYIKENKYKRKIKARTLWLAILDAQMETGTPYLLFKDAANKKSNQKNLGTIKSSNLCCEIIEYSSPEETAVCNLASIALSKCVKNKRFDYDKLGRLAKIVTRNLDKVIDINYYPTIESKRSNLLHRPIGIGVQGLADTFAMMGLPFDSEEAQIVNRMIFETLYYHACEASIELAEERKEIVKEIRRKIDNDLVTFESSGDKLQLFDSTQIEGYKTLRLIEAEIDGLKEEHLGAYSSFNESPLSNGEFQFNLWGKRPTDRYDWNKLKERVVKSGMRNSLLMAPMPTASTSQILGNNEAIEPFTNNIYTRRTIAGEFIVVNKYLMKELIELGLWTRELKDNIIANRGSIQHVTNISKEIKDKYKISWELSMKTLINMAADRGQYICQSQSMNLWIEDPDYSKLTAMHFYSWSKGLKTGIYYLRRKPKHNAQQFTITPEECLMCGS